MANTGERSERGEMKRGRARRRTNYRWKSIIIGSGEATRDTVGSGSGSSSGDAMREAVAVACCGGKMAAGTRDWLAL